MDTKPTLEDINKRLAAEMQQLYYETAVLKDNFAKLDGEVRRNLSEMKDQVTNLMEMMISNNISTKTPTIRKPKPASDSGAVFVPVVPMTQAAQLTQVAQGAQSVSTAAKPVAPGQVQMSLEIFFKAGIMDKVPEVIATITPEDIKAVVGDYPMERLNEKQLYELSEKLWPIVRSDPARKEAMLLIKNGPKQ